MSTLASQRHGLTRRWLIASGAALVAAPALAQPNPRPAPSWLAYERRLTARLVDAGGGAFDAGFSRGLLAQTNQFRASQGIKALVWEDSLAACARAHAADMAARNYFAHESPEGFTHIDRVSLLDRDLCGQTAENLAYREYPSERVVPSQIDMMWQASPGHRENLLNPAFGLAGCGSVRVGDRVYAAAVYADAEIRLGDRLPLTVAGGPQLAAALAGASPVIRQLSVTAPFTHPTWMASAADPLPPLTPGIWQLRPLRASGPGRFDVLRGPLFAVM